MDTQKLSIAIQAFIKKQSANAAYYEENWNERKERKAYYQSFTKDKLLAMTEEDFLEYNCIKIFDAIAKEHPEIDFCFKLKKYFNNGISFILKYIFLFHHNNYNHPKKHSKYGFYM